MAEVVSAAGVFPEAPPDAVPVTTLDLVPGALFPGDITPDATPAAPAPHRTRQRVTSKKGS
jgi:hypothetical protein